MKIHLFITHYNSIQYLQKCLTSIFSQTVSIPFQAVLVDDATFEPYIIDLLSDWSKKEPERLVIIRNTEHLGKGVNLFKCLDAANCEPEDIICVLDGDDWLASPYSLQTVVECYQTKKCWVTYGSYRCSNGNLDYFTTPLKTEHYESEKRGRGFRECSWVFSHLFTAKAFLWFKLPRDINMFNGKQGMFAADQVFNLPIAEMAGSARIQNIDKILMIYNNENPINEDKIDFEEQCSIDQQNRQRAAFVQFKLS